jgi:hypothetical protein
MNSSNLSTVDVDAFHLPNVLKFTVILFLAFVLTATISLNLLSVICITNAKAFTPINILLMNLCISQIIYTLNIPIFLAKVIIKDFVYSQFLLNISLLTDILALIVSIRNQFRDNYYYYIFQVNVHSIAALTLERYFCLRDSKKITNDKLKTLIVCILIFFLWIVAFGFALPKSLSVVQNIDLDGHAQVESTWSAQKMKIYFTVLLILNFVLPYGIIIIFSINILRFLRNWAKASNKLTNNRGKRRLTMSAESEARFFLTQKSFEKKEKSVGNNLAATTEFTRQDCEPSVKRNGSKSFARRLSSFRGVQRSEARVLESRVNIIKKRTTFFVLAVAISYLITWSPLWAFQVYIEFGEDETQYIQIINSIIFVFHYLNGVINPLLFMFLTQNFKDYYAKLKSDILRMFKKSEFEEYIANRRKSSFQTQL